MWQLQIFTFSPIQENTFILYNQQKSAIIIDPGCYEASECQVLSNYLKDNGLTPVQLVNTHCHLDHIFGNKWIARQYNLELFIHPNEERVLAFGPQSGTMWGLPFENYEGQLHFLLPGDAVKINEDELKVLFAPGHSPGSICFYCEAQGFVIGGDVLFKGSIGRTDLPGGNYNALLLSIREQLFTLPNDTIVYPGHGEPTTIGEEKMNNPFFKGL